MNYNEWKHIYIDKTMTLAQWQGIKNQTPLPSEENLVRIRMNAAKNRIVLTSELSRVLDVNSVSEIVSKVRAAPENVRMLWNLSQARIKILDKDFNPICAIIPPPL